MVEIEQKKESPRVDAEKINELKEILGEDLREIIEEFTRIVPDALGKIAVALQCGDSNQVFIEAHTLKSSSGNLGLTRFSQLCAILESQARENNMQSPEIQLQQLNEEFPAGVDALNSMM